MTGGEEMESCCPKGALGETLGKTSYMKKSREVVESKSFEEFKSSEDMACGDIV